MVFFKKLVLIWPTSDMMTANLNQRKYYCPQLQSAMKCILIYISNDQIGIDVKSLK